MQHILIVMGLVRETADKLPLQNLIIGMHQGKMTFVPAVIFTGQCN